MNEKNELVKAYRSLLNAKAYQSIKHVDDEMIFKYLTRGNFGRVKENYVNGELIYSITIQRNKSASGFPVDLQWKKID